MSNAFLDQLEETRLAEIHQHDCGVCLCPVNETFLSSFPDCHTTSIEHLCCSTEQLDDADRNDKIKQGHEPKAARGETQRGFTAKAYASHITAISVPQGPPPKTDVDTEVDSNTSNTVLSKAVCKLASAVNNRNEEKKGEDVVNEKEAFLGCCSFALVDTCAHVYHLPCILTWSRRDTSCPLCKMRFGFVSEYSSNGRKLFTQKVDQVFLADVLTDEDSSAASSSSSEAEEETQMSDFSETESDNDDNVRRRPNKRTCLRPRVGGRQGRVDISIASRVATEAAHLLRRPRAVSRSRGGRVSIRVGRGASDERCAVAVGNDESSSSSVVSDGRKVTMARQLGTVLRDAWTLSAAQLSSQRGPSQALSNDSDTHHHPYTEDQWRLIGTKLEDVVSDFGDSSSVKQQKDRMERINETRNESTDDTLYRRGDASERDPNSSIGRRRPGRQLRPQIWPSSTAGHTEVGVSDRCQKERTQSDAEIQKVMRRIERSLARLPFYGECCQSDVWLPTEDPSGANRRNRIVLSEEGRQGPLDVGCSSETVNAVTNKLPTRLKNEHCRSALMQTDANTEETNTSSSISSPVLLMPANCPDPTEESQNDRKLGGVDNNARQRVTVPINWVQTNYRKRSFGFNLQPSYEEDFLFKGNATQ